jgi:hypothetical protein
MQSKGLDGLERGEEMKHWRASAFREMTIRRAPDIPQAHPVPVGFFLLFARPFNDKHRGKGNRTGTAKCHDGESRH